MGIMPCYLPFLHFIPSILVINCDTADYGSVPGGGVDTESKGVQEVVVTKQGGCGREEDNWSGGGIDGSIGVCIWDGEGYIISWWEDNVANITLGTETHAPLDYDPGLEHHLPIISMIGELEGQLERDNILVKNPIGQNNNLYKMM